MLRYKVVFLKQCAFKRPWDYQLDSHLLLLNSVNDFLSKGTYIAFKLLSICQELTDWKSLWSVFSLNTRGLRSSVNQEGKGPFPSCLSGQWVTIVFLRLWQNSTKLPQCKQKKTIIQDSLYFQCTQKTPSYNMFSMM